MADKNRRFELVPDTLELLKDIGGGFHAKVVAAALYDVSGNALIKLEDAAHASGDAGIQVLAVRQDTLSVLAANGDYIPLVVDTNGRLYVKSELPAAVVAADNTAYPTAPFVNAVMYGNDGSTLDMLDAVNGGILKTAMHDGLGTAINSANTASLGFGTVVALEVMSAGVRYSGSAYEVERNNNDITVLASAARTVETNSADLTIYNGDSAHVVIDVTVFGGNLTPVIEGKDALSGKYYEILRGVAITGTGTTVLKVGPGILAAANVAAQDKLPRTWRVQMEVAGSNSNTYSVGASVGD